MRFGEEGSMLPKSDVDWDLCGFLFLKMVIINLIITITIIIKRYKTILTIYHHYWNPPEELAAHDCCSGKTRMRCVCSRSLLLCLRMYLLHMCVCVYVCMCVCVYVCMCVICLLRMYVCACACVQNVVRVLPRSAVSAHVSVPAYVSMYVYVCV